MPHKLIPLAWFVAVGGLFMWLQVLLSLAIRVVLRSDSEALQELLGFAPLGRVYASKPYLMRVKLFFPWVPVRSIGGYPSSVGCLVWAARLSGTGFLVCFAGALGFAAYLVGVGA